MYVLINYLVSVELSIMDRSIVVINGMGFNSILLIYSCCFKRMINDWTNPDSLIIWYDI